jgi:hypothetical protein
MTVRERFALRLYVELMLRFNVPSLGGAFAVNQMSAGAQLACILSLVGYSVSFATNDYAGGNAAARGATGEPHDDQERLIHVA